MGLPFAWERQRFWIFQSKYQEAFLFLSLYYISVIIEHNESTVKKIMTGIIRVTASKSKRALSIHAGNVANFHVIVSN